VDFDALRMLIELAIGLFAGVLSGIMGIGGGVVLVPAMTFFLGVDQHVAQGVSLMVIVPTAIVGATTHYKQGNVDLRVALALGAFSIVGGLVGSYVAQSLDAHTLKLLFGIFLLATGGRMVWTRKPKQEGKEANARA
jgi:uncharacterized protein